MKLFKKRNIQALIYGLFMLLPFCAILGRVIYVQSNKNAYESYYGETINNFEQVLVTNSKDLKVGDSYHFASKRTPQVLNNSPVTLKVTDIRNFSTSYGGTIDYLDRVTQIKITYYTDNYLLLMDVEYNALGTFNLSTYDFVFDFTLTDNLYPTNTDITPYIDTFVSYYVYNQYSYLDNAFEYSIDRFVDENNFGNFDFFQWFSTFFLQDNAVNNLYVHFINWYMNYMLYVSLGYLIFSILMWFVNFFRSLVEKSTDLNL